MVPDHAANTPRTYLCIMLCRYYNRSIMVLEVLQQKMYLLSISALQ